MGISFQEARMLLRARDHDHVVFDCAATIGRQSLYLLPGEAASLCEEFALGTDAPWSTIPAGQPADSFFTHALGVTRLSAIDASPYEGADIVHDMNERLPNQLSRPSTSC